MRINKTVATVSLVVIITWVIAWIYDPRLPDPVPSHWNIHGEVDGYMDKPWGVYILPLISTMVNALLLFLPKIAPKGFKLKSGIKIYELLVLVNSIFQFGVMVLAFEAGLNQNIDMNLWMMLIMGALFVLIGNYLSKVPKNFFLGIRTPWTLSSDQVWYKTHRLASWTFVLAGLVMMVGGLLEWPMSWLIGFVVVAALVPVIYSLWIYKKIEGFKDPEDDK